MRNSPLFKTKSNLETVSLEADPVDSCEGRIQPPNGSSTSNFIKAYSSRKPSKICHIELDNQGDPVARSCGIGRSRRLGRLSESWAFPARVEAYELFPEIHCVYLSQAEGFISGTTI